MAFRLSVAMNPSPKTMTLCKTDPKKHIVKTFKQLANVFLNENLSIHLKMSFAECWPIQLDVNMLCQFDMR